MNGRVSSAGINNKNEKEIFLGLGFKNSSLKKPGVGPPYKIREGWKREVCASLESHGTSNIEAGWVVYPVSSEAVSNVALFIKPGPRVGHTCRDIEKITRSIDLVIQFDLLHRGGY